MGSDTIRKGFCKSLGAIAALAVCASPRPAAAATLAVPPGGDLQMTLNTAQPGDTIVLAPGATYAGNFTLPNKVGALPITLTTSPEGLPGEGSRISPAFAAQLAKLRSPNAAPALVTAPGAHHWRVQLVEITSSGTGDLVTLGDGSSAQNSLALVPHDLVIDRCYIHGIPGVPQKRGVTLSSASTTISGSYISEIKARDQDTQAVGGANGPGPFVITNNYLEAAGENVMFGGADPSIPGLVPTDITITSNQIAKQPSWRGSPWSVKNLLELKNARHVLVQGNTFDYNWEAGQAGFAIVLTPRNQDGNCPWCIVADVTFQGNIVRHSAGGVSILGTDDTHPSQATVGILIRGNLFADIDNQTWGGSGYFLLILAGPRDVTIDHNTVIQDHAMGLIAAEGVAYGFTFTNNLTKHNDYGVIGRDRAPGNDTIGADFPASTFVRNVIADANPARYPPGNWYPTSAEFQEQFVSYAAGDYRLVAGSPLRGAGTDGADVGANLGAPAEPAPAAPANLSASVNGSTVVLTWTASDDRASSYVVEAGSGPSGIDLARISTGNGATSYTASDVAGGTYYVRVRAANAGGVSRPSNETVVVVATRGR
jgi:fibronectin type III domain protein